MKPIGNQAPGAFSLLNGSFVSLPYALLERFSTLDLSHKDFMVLLQILGAIQVSGREILSPLAIGELCRISEREAGDILDGLLDRGFLAIVESVDSAGDQIVYFDLHPLWAQLLPKEEDVSAAPSAPPEANVVSLFEQEFGRPLSWVECEQIRQWLNDGYPDWMLVQALREAVLANKSSFRYMDRILYDWQRNRVRTPQDLEQYRQSYRERVQGKDEVAATSRRQNATTPRSQTRPNTSKGGNQPARDERYSAFYELFPDS